MPRGIQVAAGFIALVGSITAPGCRIEAEPDNRFIPISGTVTYNGRPVETGTIHFVSINPDAPPASGAIEDGAIKNLTTRTQGDGVPPGKYKVTVTARDAAEAALSPKRTAAGPDPAVVAEEANRARRLIPPRYSNAKDSDLKAEVSTENRTFHFDLKD